MTPLQVAAIALGIGVICAAVAAVILTVAALLHWAWDMVRAARRGGAR